MNRYKYIHNGTQEVKCMHEGNSPPVFNPDWGDEADYDLVVDSADAAIAARQAASQQTSDLIAADQDANKQAADRLKALSAANIDAMATLDDTKAYLKDLLTIVKRLHS